MTSRSKTQDSAVRTAVTYRQFPIRLEASLADALDHYAAVTRIPKTEMIRTAVRRVLIDLERTGVRSALEQIHAE